MNNRFNINEEEKNRIRGLHKDYSIIKEETIMGFDSRDLTSQAAKFLEGKRDISFDLMVQLIAGCFDDKVNHWLHSLRFESGLAGDIGDAYLEGDGGGVIMLRSNNGKELKVNVCGQSGLAGTLSETLKTHPDEVRKGINALLTTTEFPNIYNISDEEDSRCQQNPDSNFCKRLNSKRGNLLKWVPKGSGRKATYTLAKL